MSDIIQVNPLVFGGEGESVHANMLVKLWENPDPTAEFAAQNIEWSSSDYDYLLWDLRFTTNVNFCFITPKGSGTIFNMGGTTGNSYTTTIARTATVVSDTKYSISDCSDQRRKDPSYVCPGLLHRIRAPSEGRL